MTPTQKVGELFWIKPLFLWPRFFNIGAGGLFLLSLRLFMRPPQPLCDSRDEVENGLQEEHRQRCARRQIEYKTAPADASGEGGLGE